ncbi:TolB family protein [Ekhidna sp.]|uniref:TolB family protein n=1 Tax=Ekhidna sp. TaxID=2608089 RepID=UPI003BABD328
MRFTDMLKSRLWASSIFLALFLSCDRKNSKSIGDKYLVEKVPTESPLPFLPGLVSDKYLIHKGIFSNDLDEYYFTVSDKNFAKFDVKVIHKENGQWSASENAFFNSNYNDHGMSFSPDGNTVYFSSTRPVESERAVDTWHIWKSELMRGKWQQPEYVDIPNLREKLTSHPTITQEGNLYFHSSNPDYSNMDLFVAKLRDGKFQNAKKVFESGSPRCTPYVSPNGDYLIYASIEGQLDLMISNKKANNNWGTPRPLPSRINDNGQGNPYVSPDGDFLFFTKGGEEWSVQWVSTKAFMSMTDDSY